MADRQASAEAALAALPLSVRLLQWLVIGLTASLILGVITVVVVIVIRFPFGDTPAPLLPDTITLPPGVTAQAVTVGPGWYAVVTGDAILIYDRDTGALRQRVAVAAE